MVATATQPCLGKQRKRNKTRATTAKPLLGDNWRQRRINELREQLEEKKPDPPPLSETIVKCPYVSKSRLISREDMDIQLDELFAELRSWLSEQAKVDQERLAYDIRLIKKGKLSNRELSNKIVSSFLEKIEDKQDKSLVRHLPGWYKTTSANGFQAKFAKIFSSLTIDTQELLLELITEVPIEDFESIGDRILAAKLDALYPEQKQSYYERRREVMTRTRESVLMATNGPSMLPTIRNGSRVVVFPLHPTEEIIILDELQVGNVVTFIVYFCHGKKDWGNTKFVVKRVVGLPGDLVKDEHGKTVQVPEGHFWAVGDNLEKSYDSRHFGAVPAQNLKSKALIGLHPPRLFCSLDELFAYGSRLINGEHIIGQLDE